MRRPASMTGLVASTLALSASATMAKAEVSFIVFFGWMASSIIWVVEAAVDGSCLTSFIGSDSLDTYTYRTCDESIQDMFLPESHAPRLATSNASLQLTHYCRLSYGPMAFTIDHR